MHWTVARQVRQIGRTIARPVWQTGHPWRWRRSACGDYASPDNWRTCYPHMPIGMLGYIVYCCFVCVCVRVRMIFHWRIHWGSLGSDEPPLAGSGCGGWKRSNWWFRVVH